MIPLDRNYFQVGVEIKNHIIKVLKKLNADNEFNGHGGDKVFIDTLMIKAFDETELAAENDLSLLKLSFIKG